ncbi:MAG: hypothetical protein ACJ788_09655 [Ktedonobacteraceae bacterium]
MRAIADILTDYRARGYVIQQQVNDFVAEYTSIREQLPATSKFAVFTQINILLKRYPIIEAEYLAGKVLDKLKELENEDVLVSTQQKGETTMATIGKAAPQPNQPEKKGLGSLFGQVNKGQAQPQQKTVKQLALEFKPTTQDTRIEGLCKQIKEGLNVPDDVLAIIRYDLYTNPQQGMTVAEQKEHLSWLIEDAYIAAGKEDMILGYRPTGRASVIGRQIKTPTPVNTQTTEAKQQQFIALMQYYLHSAETEEQRRYFQGVLTLAEKGLIEPEMIDQALQAVRGKK